MRIFVSYRRGDTGGHAGRLADALASRYGRHHVFIDVDAIRLGSPFEDAIVRAVASCDVLVALIASSRVTVDSAPGPEAVARQLVDAISPSARGDVRPPGRAAPVITRGRLR